MKIEYFKESDFTKATKEISDELYALAYELHKKFGTNKVPILVPEDSDELRVLHQAKNRVPGERDTHSYLITIKKIPFN